MHSWQISPIFYRLRSVLFSPFLPHTTASECVVPLSLSLLFLCGRSARETEVSVFCVQIAHKATQNLRPSRCIDVAKMFPPCLWGELSFKMFTSFRLDSCESDARVPRHLSLLRQRNKKINREAVICQIPSCMRKTLNETCKMLSDGLTEENSLQSAMSYFLACSGQLSDIQRVFIRPQFLFPPSKTSPRLKQTQSLDDAHITSTMAGHRRISFHSILPE